MEQNQALDKNISFKMIIKFSLPTIISMIFMSIYSSVDGVFVSRLVGTNALSSVNIVMPIVLMIMAIGTMFGSGGNALIAKKLGEGKNREAKENFSLLIVVAFIISSLIAVICYIFLNPLLHFLGADDSIIEYCRDYAIPILVLTPVSIFGMIFHMSFITAGKAHFGLIFSVIGGIVNIILDYLFIAVLGMGIRGAALATGIGYSVPSVVGFIYFLFKRNGSIYIIKPKFDIQVILKSCSNGASEMVTSLSNAVVTILLNNILMRLAGSDGVASITIILYTQGLLASAYMGYSFGISPIISYNYGKQDSERLKKIYKISLRTILVASIVTFSASLLFAGPLVNIFTHSGTNVYDMAVRGFRIFSICFLLMGFNGFASAMFTALNNGIVSAILSFFRTLVFIVISALLLPVVIGIDGVWLSIPVAEVLGVLMTIYYFKKMKSVYNYA